MLQKLVRVNRFMKVSVGLWCEGLALVSVLLQRLMGPLFSLAAYVVHETLL